MTSQRKNKEIPWSVKELSNWSETPDTFIMMIVTNGWLDNIYDGDLQQRDRLQFIRRWWKENVRDGVFIHKKEKKRIFEETQLKLML